MRWWFQRWRSPRFHRFMVAPTRSPVCRSNTLAAPRKPYGSWTVKSPGRRSQRYARSLGHTASPHGMASHLGRRASAAGPSAGERGSSTGHARSPWSLFRLAIIGDREFEGCSLALGGDVAFVSLKMPRRWWCASGDPDLHGRAGAGQTEQAAPTACHLGPLAHRREPEMTSA